MILRAIATVYLSQEMISFRFGWFGLFGLEAHIFMWASIVLQQVAVKNFRC